MLHSWCHLKCCCLGVSSVYTIQPRTSLQCHFIQSHIGRVYVCLAVTCYLHFWQNDRDLLRITAVTRGWNGYRNKNQHRKLTLEKNILPPLLQGFEPATFQSRVRRSNRWAIPLPEIVPAKTDQSERLCSEAIYLKTATQFTITSLQLQIRWRSWNCFEYRRRRLVVDPKPEESANEEGENINCTRLTPHECNKGHNNR